MSREKTRKPRSAVSNDFRRVVLGAELLRDQCLPVVNDSGVTLVYQIVDPAKKIVRLVTHDSTIFTQIVMTGYDRVPKGLRLTQGIGGKAGTLVTRDVAIVAHLSPRAAREIVETFVIREQQRITVRPFAWKDDPSWTLHRLDFDISPGPTPAWEEFLVRLSDAPAFMAWIWSIFAEEHVGRQALWLLGTEGTDGKSTVIRLLGKLVGSAHGVLDGDERENRFCHSSFYDKRLLIYPDCKKPSFVKGQVFRNYTGKDIVRVEFKGRQPFEAEVYSRILIGANFLPSIENENADLTRLLVVKVAAKDASKPGDKDWPEKLRSEFPHFLHRCREAYRELCKDDVLIRTTNADAQEDLEEASSTTEEKWEALLVKYFEIRLGTSTSAPGETEAHVFAEALSAERLSPTETNSFKRFLKRKGVTHERVQRGKRRARVYVGLELSDYSKSLVGAAQDAANTYRHIEAEQMAHVHPGPGQASGKRGTA